MGGSTAADARVTQVVFDLGRVLVDLDGDWPRRIDLDPEAARAWLVQSREYAELERGRIGHEAVFQGFGAHFGRDPEACAMAFTACVVGIADGALALLDRVSRPACLSNSNRLHWAMFDPQRHLRDRLSVILSSHHLGARKPDLAVYARAEARLGTGDVLFLDDGPANVAAARAHGWQAECVVGVAEATRVLESAGLLGVDSP